MTELYTKCIFLSVKNLKINFLEKQKWVRYYNLFYTSLMYFSFLPYFIYLPHSLYGLLPLSGVATAEWSAQPIWHMFLRMPFLPQPSPESALTRATPVLGHTHSLNQSFTHSLRPVSFVQFTYKACLWIVGETGAPGGNPHRHGENMQTPHRKASWLSRDSNQWVLLWGNSATHTTK